MKPFLLAVALMGASFSGLTINAKAASYHPGGVNGGRLVEEIPSKR